MFDINVSNDGRVEIHGNLDSNHADRARSAFARLSGTVTVDLSGMNYISSAGLGVLLSTQKRLRRSGDTLRLVNPSERVRETFRVVGFDQVFDIE